MQVSTELLSVPMKLLGKPFHCFKCNTLLGTKVSQGLKVDTVTLHLRQSFSCNKCKWRYKSVALAFATELELQKQTEEQKNQVESQQAAATKKKK